METSELTVCITGAAGHIATAFYVLLGTGQVFGPRIQMRLRLLELPDKLSELQGIKMQIEDCAFSLIKSIEVTADGAEAFKDIDVGIFLGGFPRKPGMERQDLLQINNKIFKDQGQLLQLHAKATAKILVVSNPSNTNCLTLAENCPKIPSKNFTSLMQLDQNRAISMIAQKAQVSSESVKNIIVWGNHSMTQYPDISYATINGKSVREFISDQQFLNSDFVVKAQKRGGLILQVAKQTSFLSAANAIKDHIRNWFLGTEPGNWTSMGAIIEEPIYGIPKGICFSVPVHCNKFDYQIVEGITLDENTQKRIKLSLQELQNERDEAQLE